MINYVLKKYKHIHSCIICDIGHINSEELLEKKAENRKRIYESLEQKQNAFLKMLLQILYW